MSESWFDGVTVTVEIAFGDGPLADTPTYTDVTAYCRGFSTNRGRSDEYSPFSPGTAQVVLDNRDRRFDPEYSSGPYYGDLLPMRRIRISAVYSATTYRVFTGYVMGWPQQYTNPNDSTVTVQCVDGFRILENFPLADNAYETEVLADSPVAYWPMQSLVDGEFVDLVDDQSLRRTYADVAGVVSSSTTHVDTSTVDNDYPLGASTAFTLNVDPPALNLHKTAWFAGIAPSSAPKAVEFWIRETDPQTQSSLRFSYTLTNHIGFDSGGDVRYSNSTDNRAVDFALGAWPVDGDWVHVVIYADTTNIYSRVNGAAYASTALSVGTNNASNDVGTVRLEFDQEDDSFGGDPWEIAHIAFYSTVPTTARFDEHYYAGLHAWGHPIGERPGERIGRVLDEVGWPSGLRDLDTGDTPLTSYVPGGVTALSYIRSVEASEQGAFFIAKDGTASLVGRQTVLLDTAGTTFSDDGSDTPYFAITVDANTVDAIRNRVDASYSDGTRTSKDATSISAYGQGYESVDASTVDKAAIASELANYRVRLLKDPQTRITSLTVLPRRKPTTAIPAVLGLELMDRVNVERTPQRTGSAIDKDVVVQGIRHDMNPGSGEWMVEMYCSPAPDNYTEAPYLVVNDATYGQLGNTAGNKIPF